MTSTVWPSNDQQEWDPEAPLLEWDGIEQEWDGIEQEWSPAEPSGDTVDATEPIADQQYPHRWRPGTSGNPRGRPVGARNRATVAAAKLLDGEAEELTRKCIELAKAGDGTALRLCIERIIPPLRDRAIHFDLPKVVSVADVPAALASVLDCVASGEITPNEGGALCGLLGAVSKAFEVAELARRLAVIEQRLDLGDNVG